jgi:hypothetical protein
MVTIDKNWVSDVYMMALHPSGAKGYLFQSYGLLRISYADLVGSILKARNKLSVSCICGVSQSHSWRGKSLSVVASTAMKASLKVWIACSAVLTRWLWGSTSCNLQSFLVRNILMCFIA